MLLGSSLIVKDNLRVQIDTSESVTRPVQIIVLVITPGFYQKNTGTTLRVRQFSGNNCAGVACADNEYPRCDGLDMDLPAPTTMKSNLEAILVEKRRA